MRAWLATVAALLMMARGAHAQPKPIMLRIAVLSPASAPWIMRLATDVDAQTQHRVTVGVAVIAPRASAADEQRVLDRLGKGKLEGAELTSTGLALVDPSVRVLELPALFDSIEETDVVVAKAWPALAQRFAAHQLVLAAREEVGWLSFYAQGTLDLAKATIALDPGDAILGDLYTRLAVSSVALPAAKVDGALTQQQIDTCSATPAAMRAMSSRATVAQRSSLGLGYRTGAIVLTDAALGSLAAGDRAVVLRLIAKAAAAQVMSVRSAALDAHNELVRQGVVTVAPSLALAAAFDAAAHKTWQSLAGTLYTPADLQAVLQARADYRKQHHGAGTPPP